jgi:hypothetical protein
MDAARSLPFSTFPRNAFLERMQADCTMWTGKRMRMMAARTGAEVRRITLAETTIVVWATLRRQIPKVGAGA